MFPEYVDREFYLAGESYAGTFRFDSIRFPSYVVAQPPILRLLRASTCNSYYEYVCTYYLLYEHFLGYLSTFVHIRANVRYTYSLAL